MSERPGGGKPQGREGAVLRRPDAPLYQEEWRFIGS